MEAAIELCNERSAAVPDSITNSMRKNLTEAVKRRKLKLINDAWYEGNNPDGLRLSCVCPIPKPGKNPVCASNVRSILLTLIRCKLMERMVLSRIEWIVQQRREVLHSAQMGCHKSLGPQDSLALILEYLAYQPILCLNQIVVALDVRKAFDTLAHSRVIDMACKLGVQRRLLNFVKYS